MQFFMELEFEIEKIKANPKLSAKFTRLTRDEHIQRIYAKINFILKDGSELTPIKAIIDTGAILSLFPEYILAHYPGIKTEEHTLWGIVDSRECHLSAKLACRNKING